MRMHTVWATRTHSTDEPELVCAWDEYSVDNNPEGFEKDWRAALATWGNDLDQYRHILIDVPLGNILTAFEPHRIYVS